MGRHRVRCCYCNFLIARDRRIPHCSCLAVCNCDEVCQERRWYQEHRRDCKYDALVRTQLGRGLPKEIYRDIFKYVETLQRQPNATRRRLERRLARGLNAIRSHFEQG